jgi:hypothetical protein
MSTTPTLQKPATPGRSYPLRLTGTLDPATSKWLWLVKVVLVVPHAIVLALLWIAAVAATVCAGVAVVATGRYPRGIFDFVVGVLRWTWRVSFYFSSAFATDRYPPFSLHPDPDYPADLSVEYPQHLSRGLVLVKWWLLAIPQYIIVAAFTGGFGGWHLGLITILALIGIVSKAAKNHYPEPIFDLVMGLNRWSFRVAVYGLLLTDVYPPFRLDSGPDERPAGD